MFSAANKQKESHSGGHATHGCALPAAQRGSRMVLRAPALLCLSTGTAMLVRATTGSVGSGQVFVTLVFPDAGLRRHCIGDPAIQFATEHKHAGRSFHAQAHFVPGNLYDRNHDIVAQPDILALTSGKDQHLLTSIPEHHVRLLSAGLALAANRLAHGRAGGYLAITMAGLAGDAGGAASSASRQPPPGAQVRRAARSSSDRPQPRAGGQLGFLEPLAGRVVKQHLVTIAIPDRAKPHLSWTAHAKVNSARPMAAQQSHFRHLIGAQFELAMLAQG